MDVVSFTQNIEKCIAHLADELAHIHTGRANAELVENIKVNAYEIENPLKNVASISVADAKSIVVSPWDKTLKEAIVKGVAASNLGFLSSIEGDIVRITLPDMTEERRLQIVKVMKEKVEQSRIAVRNVRQETMKEIEEQVKNGLSEDEGDREKVEVEKKVKEANEKIEEMRKTKEKDLMEI